MSSSERKWTSLEIINFSIGYLKERGVAEPRLDAELLLSHVLGWKRIDLYTRFEQVLAPEVLARFKELLKKRGERIPVKYLLGTCEFMGLDFKVTPAVLIPRPETEHLVERAIAHLKTIERRPRRGLDVGTGSGNIACSIAHGVEDAEVLAVDVSPEALAVAKENAQTLKVSARVRFAQTDLFKSIVPPGESGPFDVIASNPPYVSIDEKATLEPEVAKYEPAQALFAEGEALGPTQRILEQCPALLSEQGIVLIEIGHDAAEKVEKLAEGIGGIKLVEFIKDYGGHRRVAVFKGS